MNTTPSGLQFTDSVLGDGDTAAAGERHTNRDTRPASEKRTPLKRSCSFRRLVRYSASVFSGFSLGFFFSGLDGEKVTHPPASVFVLAMLGIDELSRAAK